MRFSNPFKPLTTALASALLLLPASLQASVSEKFATSGTFTPPPGVTSVTVEVWGGGGAGGSAQRISSNAGGGGGGGGAYVKMENIPVTPGVPYTVTIPAAASAPASGFADGDTVDGADVTFTGDLGVSVTGSGGKGGQCAVNRSAPGGAGGAADPVASLSWSGGNGATNTSGNSGGGGSAASDLGNGNNGSGNSAGGNKLGSDADHSGGAGGVGRTGSNVGGPGTAPGGGGGGGRCGPNPEIRRGGAGGRGQIIISYTGATATKANNADDLNLTTSWVGGNAPDSAGIAMWDSTVTSANTTVLGADLEWGGINIAGPAGLVTIDAGNTLTLAGGIDMSAAAQNLTLNCDLVTGGPTTWDVAEDRTLTLAGIVSGGFNIAKQGNGIIILSGPNTYSGATAINGGTLRIGASNVIPNGSGKGDVVVGAGSTLDLNGFSESINGLSGTGMVDNTAADTTSTLTAGANNVDSSFGGVMRNTGSGSTLNLVKIGSGQLSLSGTNTLTGTVTVSNGNLTIATSNPLANISGLTIGGAQLGLQSNSTLPAPITLTGNLTVIAQSGGMTNTNLNGPIGGTGNITFTTASNSFSAADTKVRLGGANGTFTGNVTITTSRDLNNMTVRIGAANAIAPTAVVTLNGGPGNNSTWADLDLFGNNQTLAGLTNVAQTGRQQRVYNSSMTDVTLTIHNATDRTFGGRLGHATAANNNFALIKSGSATFTLTGTNSHTGATTVTEGTLALVGGSQASPITVEAGGSLGFVPGSPTTSSSSVDLSNGTVRIIGSPAPGTDQRLMTASGGITGTPTFASPVAGFALELRAGDTELWLVATAGVATIVIDLGAGTEIEGGTFITSGPVNLPLPPLPAGSILTSIAVNTTLTATNNNNWASDLAVLLDPTPDTPGGDFILEITNGLDKFGADLTVGWPASANAGEGTNLIDTKTSADWSSLGQIDLATIGLFLGNAHGGPILAGTWSGTITLTYLTPAEDGYGTWAEANVGGQGPELDFDGDGVSNGVEYFLNAPAGFTALPTLDATNTITWTNGGNIPASAYGSQFVVQISDNLAQWDDVPVGDLTANSDGPGGALSHTLTGPAPRFMRLKVMPE